MLRYRFDDLAQLSRHLHVVDNSVLIFLRDHRDDVHYERVLLDLSVRKTGEQTVVRGEVVSRAQGSIRGVWVRLSDPRIARRLSEPAPLSARRMPRLSTDQMVRLHFPGGQLVAQLLDVSAGGLRVKGVRNIGPGDSCEVHLIGAPAVTSDLGAAQVLRIDGNEAGLSFTEPDSTALSRLIDSLKLSWRRALELDHLPECCARGEPLEPALPNLRPVRLAYSS